MFIRKPLAIACTLFAAGALAESPATVSFARLQTVNVYGHAERPLTQPGLQTARARLNERAGGTAVVDGDSYRDRRASTLADALGFAPGVFIQPRFGAEEARMSIRGSGLQRTFHMRGIKLLQDGVPLNLADGGGDFQAVEPLSARYVEVYRGANALEYGAATLGGAINFVAPTGHDAAPWGARFEGGEFGYRRGQVSAAGVEGKHDGYASVSAFGQDGFRDHAKQETYRFFGNYGYRFSEALDGRLYLTHVDSRSALPGNLTYAQFKRDPRQAAPGNITGDQRRDFTLTRLAGKLGWTLAPGQELSLSAYVADKSLDHPIYQVLRQDTVDAGLDLRYRLDGRINGYRNVLTAGLSGAQGETDDDRYVNVGGHPGARTNAFEQTATNLEAFIENQFYLTERLALSAGLQTVRAERESDDEYITAFDESYDETYTGTSPKFGVRYIVDDGIQLFANISRSYEPPSFGELAGGPSVTLVDAQRATSIEIGTRIETATLALDLALYRAEVRNELLALNDALGNPLGTTNAADTLHQGVELGFSWQLASTLNLNGNYLYNDFRFDNDPVYGDNELAGVPPQQLRLELKWQLPGNLYLAPNLEWTPEKQYVDHANTLSADGYAIWGVRLGGRVAKDWSWFIDGRNLGGRDYIATTNVVADAGGRDGAHFLPGDGRAVYAGFEWRPAQR